MQDERIAVTVGVVIRAPVADIDCGPVEMIGEMQLPAGGRIAHRGLQGHVEGGVATDPRWAEVLMQFHRQHIGAGAQLRSGDGIGHFARAIPIVQIRRRVIPDSAARHIDRCQLLPVEIHHAAIVQTQLGHGVHHHRRIAHAERATEIRGALGNTDVGQHCFGVSHRNRTGTPSRGIELQRTPIRRRGGGWIDEGTTRTGIQQRLYGGCGVRGERQHGGDSGNAQGREKNKSGKTHREDSGRRS